VSARERPAIAVVGAGRRRQGLGPFVARHLLAAGAEIPGFVVTSPQSAAAVSRTLADELGCDARGYLDLASLLRRERVDALAILSPAETHQRHLEAALDAGLHVFCEKPFVWGVPQLAATTRRLAQRFTARGLMLWENCLWPYMLPAFERLHPAVLARGPRKLAMLLQPASRGVQMLGDSLPHVLSLAQALLPAGERRVTALRFGGLGAEAIDVGVRVVAGARALDVEVALRRSERHPREASLTIDDHRAQRMVSGDDYRLSFADGGRSVQLPDPLQQIVSDFVRALPRQRERAKAGRGDEIVERMELLEEILAGYARHERGGALP
jgi:predicted dehydrogenase